LRNGHPREVRPVNPPPEQSARKVREPRPDYETAPLTSTSLLGKTITEAAVLWHRTLAEPTPEAFFPRIKGQRVEDITRRGKYLVFHLSLDYLLVHLRMSGDMLVTSVTEPLAPHDRLTLSLDDELRLAFNDTRKFGRVWLVDNPETVTGHLGPEPLDDNFTTSDLYALLTTRKRQIKPLLLDQTVIAGLGNIYTDESLHLSKIHPRTQSNTITQAQAEALWRNIRYVLAKGIEQNGASIDWVYRGGGFQNYFQAYGRTGEPCYTCGTPITRILVGQRSTHFCPRCQPPTM
jgi:formamidopyrimidine-DNA glycosylase